MITFDTTKHIKGSTTKAINVSKDGVPFGQIYKLANRASQDIGWTVKPLVGEVIKAPTLEAAKAAMIALAN